MTLLSFDNNLEMIRQHAKGEGPLAGRASSPSNRIAHAVDIKQKILNYWGSVELDLAHAAIPNTPHNEITAMPYGAYYVVPEVVLGLPLPGRIPVAVEDRRIAVICPVILPSEIHDYSHIIYSTIAKYIHGAVSTGTAVSLNIVYAANTQASGSVYIMHAAFDSTAGDDITGVLAKLAHDGFINAALEWFRRNFGSPAVYCPYHVALFAADNFDCGIENHFITRPVNFGRWTVTPELTESFVLDGFEKDLKVRDILEIYNETK